jgi:hypothetical protein
MISGEMSLIILFSSIKDFKFFVIEVEDLSIENVLKPIPLCFIVGSLLEIINTAYPNSTAFFAKGKR